MSAIVRYCGHNASFVADIFEVSGAVVVRANGPVEKQLTRPCSQTATHWLSDFPKPGFWRPDLGVFVVPKKQFTKLTKGGSQ